MRHHQRIIVSQTQCRELTSQEAAASIFLPFIAWPSTSTTASATDGVAAALRSGVFTTAWHVEPG
jgi:hypothetical protein